MLEISKAFQKLDIKRRKTQYGFDQAPRASSGDLAANNQFITYVQIFCIKLLSKNIVTVTIYYQITRDVQLNNHGVEINKINMRSI